MITALKYVSKCLISLKKFVAKHLHGKTFLIKWEKVQFSGEKCFPKVFNGVPRRVFSSSRYHGSALRADPAS